MQYPPRLGFALRVITVSEEYSDGGESTYTNERKNEAAEKRAYIESL
jgi:hypothetical protein